MSKLQIRAAIGADQRDVLNIALRLAECELPPGRSREQLVELDARALRSWFSGPLEGDHLLVAELDGELVGFALLCRQTDVVDQSPLMHLQAVAVAAGCEGQGIGRQLIAACERITRDSGAAAISLRAVFGNHNARRLYRHLGFVEELISYRKRL